MLDYFKYLLTRLGHRPQGFRYGDWFQTTNGLRAYPHDPMPGDVHLDDIAHALSQICRFTGHCRTFYSVAQHSVLASYVANPENAIVALLHDATEAFMGDMNRPLKVGLGKYKRLEKRWAYVIGEKFGLGDKLAKMPPDVKRADEVMLATERRDLLINGPGHLKWKLHEPPREETIVPLSPEKAEELFLKRYEELRR